jgi:hypothetical protein
VDNGRRVMTDGKHCSIGLDLCGYLLVPQDGGKPSCTLYSGGRALVLRCDTRGALCCQQCLDEQARSGEETA